jgi:creatinine amidohydrolase/Fe(II)-dependent formamide hydrolase-like protein
MERAVPDLLERRTDYTWVDLMAGSGPVALIDDWSRVSNGSGVEGDPTTASAEKGRQFAEEEVTHLIRFCRQLKALAVTPRRNYTARGSDPNPYIRDE